MMGLRGNEVNWDNIINKVDKDKKSDKIDIGLFL